MRAGDLSAEVPILLRVPAPGEVLAVTVEAGGACVVGPAAQGLGLEMAWRGDDLIPAFSGADEFLFDFGDGDGDFGTDIVRDFDPDPGDVLSFVNVLDIDSSSSGAGLDGLLSTIISEVEGDGRDVTIEFDGGGVVVLEGFGTARDRFGQRAAERNRPS